MATTDEAGLNDVHSFLEKEDISAVHIVDIDEALTRTPVRGCRKEDVFFDFSHYRSLKRAELSSDLSTAILDSYGIDPYSERSGIESRMVATQNRDQFLRIANRDYAVYLSINEAELPREPSYIETYEPRWRS